MSEVLARLGTGDKEVQLQKSLLDGKWQYELIVNGVFIMASYNDLSSRLLVRLPLQEEDWQGEPVRLLVAGLGLGYTVQEACRFPEIRAIDVVEINENVIELNRSLLAEENGHCLSDPRVRVTAADFFDYISACEARYDLICMDIDNGPMQLARSENSRVYLRDFFRQVRTRLLPGGMFWVWSCGESFQLLRDLERVFDTAGERVIWEEAGGRSTPYYLYWGRSGGELF
ncbi:MAG: hypothetical protein IK116_04210 [Firmicutes bacterium]|nr:hypothetical protein [Bacillota bacterium]